MKTYDSNMKISTIKKDMRETIIAEIQEFLHNKYENYGMVSANTIGVAMGTYEDSDGFINDTCCEITVRAKPFYDKAAQIKENGELGREINTYNLDIQIDNFKNGVEE